jgi:hypothetical protein
MCSLDPCPTARRPCRSRGACRWRFGRQCSLQSSERSWRRRCPCRLEGSRRRSSLGQKQPRRWWRCPYSTQSSLRGSRTRGWRRRLGRVHGGQWPTEMEASCWAHAVLLVRIVAWAATVVRVQTRRGARQPRQGATSGARSRCNRFLNHTLEKWNPAHRHRNDHRDSSSRYRCNQPQVDDGNHPSSSPQPTPTRPCNYRLDLRIMNKRFGNT